LIDCPGYSGERFVYPLLEIQGATRWHHSVRRPLDKRILEGVAHATQGMAQSRWGHADSAGRARNAPLGHQGVEDDQQIEVEAP
jgi:hypothetical protein